MDLAEDPVIAGTLARSTTLKSNLDEAPGLLYEMRSVSAGRLAIHGNIDSPMNRKRRPSKDEFDDDELDLDFDDEGDDDGLDDIEFDEDSLNDEGADQVTGDRPLKSFSDRLVADYASDLKGPDVLVLLMHGTTLASALRKARPELNFTFYTPEHFFYRTLQKFHGESANSSVENTGSITLACSADLPEGEFQEVIFPTFSGDSSEQAQELIQAAQLRLKSTGRLIISTNNPKDRWIQNQLKTMFNRVEVNKQKHGVACVATKSAALKKVRGFRARSAFRLGERLVYCESRPGVFSHRRIDGGARALIKSMALLNPASDSNPAKAAFSPKRIVEMGCGCGAVSMAAALEFPDAKILAIDSDARAIDCTVASAKLNDITTVETLQTSDGVIPEPRTWDLLLGNPPYYSDFRIAELFLQAAKASLKTGGRIHIVTKLLDWHDARMKQLFNAVEAHTIGEYTVFTARQR